MEQIKTRIREKLSDEKLSALYANTFYSLLDRMDEDINAPMWSDT